MTEPLSCPASRDAATTSGRGRTPVRRSEHDAPQAATRPDSPGSADAATAKRLESIVSHLSATLRELSELLPEIASYQLAVSRNKSVSATSPNEQTALPAMQKTRDLLTANDIAELMRCDAKTVRRWRREGKLPPAFTVGGLVRWEAADIERWIGNQKEDSR